MVTILIDNKKGEAKEKKPLFVSLRFILLTTYLMVGMLPVFFVTNNIMHSMEEYFVNERKAELLSNANMIAGQIASYSFLENTTNHKDVQSNILQLGEKEKFRVLIFDASGFVVYDTGYENQGNTLLIKEVLDTLDGKNVTNLKDNDTLYTTAPVLGADSVTKGAVLIVDDITSITNTVYDISKKGNNLLITVFIIIILATIILARIFTEPIKNMILVIQKMSEGHFNQRVDIDLPVHNEIMDLALSCNNMVEQLEKVEYSRQQFVSDVSHELRTPLSCIKVLSESILNDSSTSKETYLEFLGDINSEVDRLSRIVDDLLTLVRIDQTEELPLTFAEVDLHDMTENIIKRLQPLSDTKEIDVKYSNNKSIVAVVSNSKLNSAISNILDNAIKYTPVGGEINVKLTADHQNAFLSIADNGIGIPESEINHIFERFYRVDKTRDRETGGTGLGLSISNRTVVMHNGSIRVYSEENKGTTISVRIPLKRSSNM